MTSTSGALTEASQVNQAPSIILYDGVCGLCNNIVTFVIDHDADKKFKFAALQSDFAKSLLQKHGLSTTDMDTVVLVEPQPDGGEKAYTKSTAALRILDGFGGAWKLAFPFLAVPEMMRDAVYELVAKNRYAWFGKYDACRMPTPDLKSRFLD